MDSTAGDVVLHIDSTAPSRSQRGYDRLALAYHAVEWLVFGNQLQHARVALIDDLPPWNRLLILGDGNGRLLEQLCTKQLSLMKEGFKGKACVRITSLDHSRRMLRQQQTRVDSIHATQQIPEKVAAQVDYVHEDACSYQPEVGAYDVVVTPFFLDCFSLAELHQHLPQWLAALRVGGRLLHVDFIIPQSPWQRLRAKLLLWSLRANIPPIKTAHVELLK